MQQILRKRLLKLLQTEMDKIPAVTRPTLHYKRHEATIYADWDPLAKVVASSSNDFVVHWVTEVVSTFFIDKVKINEGMRAAAPSRDSVEWSL